MMNPYNIINKLRRYPSIGMPEDGIFDEDGGFQKALKELGTYVPDVKALANAIRDLTTEGNNLSAGLESLSILQAGMNAEFLKGVKSATFLIEREKDLAKAFGITAKASALLSAQYSTTAEKLGISNELMSKYRLSINKILPGMSANILKTGAYGESLIRTNDLLQQHIGLTDDQTNSLTLAAAATGTDLETSVYNTAKLAAAMQSVTGETDTFKVMMEGVANTSLELRSEYSKFPGSLEVATLKARRLGMSMADIDTSAKHLLNIEESVGKELEYQLISGKRLVNVQGESLTNKLREAKLAGNPLKQAEAMTEILESQSNIIENGNYLQKQALADAIGLTTEQLAAANAQKKLQDMIYQKMKDAKKLKIGEDGTEIKSAIELTTEDIEKGMRDFSGSMTDQQKKDAATNFKLTESLITPAQQQVDLLKQIADKGIRIITSKKDYGAKLNEMTSGIDASRGNLEKGTEYLRQPPAAFGKSQTISGMATGMVEEVGKYAKAFSGSTIVTPLITAAKLVVTTAIHTAHGTKVEGEVPATEEKDAFMMHDGVINFDKRDKFTMIASPYGAMHESVADKITGGGGSGLDANAIGKAIQSAILTGLSSVSWTVNLDPMAVDKAIKFNSGRLNS